MNKVDFRGLPVIKCPHCGQQYLPSEIFIPEYLFGKPEDIVKSPTGEIIYLDYQKGKAPELVERYTCDNCDKPFVVEASLSFKAKAEKEELDFSTLSTSLI